MSDQIKALYDRMTERVWNEGELDAIDEYFARDVVIHSAPPELPAGSAGARETVSTFRSALSGFKLGTPIVIAEGDKVAAYWTMSGTQDGDLMGIPATGKRIETSGMSLVRYEGGKIAEIWGASDQLGLLKQIGAIPS